MSKAATFKGSEWMPYLKLFDIPQYDLDRNRNLKQNEGY